MKMKKGREGKEEGGKGGGKEGGRGKGGKGGRGEGGKEGRGEFTWIPLGTAPNPEIRKVKAESKCEIYGKSERR